MTDWSKTGRRSRRKGKRFECQIARLLTEWTGGKWETTRNSGRTDLKGDVYCPGNRAYDSVLVECKDRKTFTVAAMVKGLKSVENQLEGIYQRYLDNYPKPCNRLLIFIKTDAGVFVNATSYRLTPAPLDSNVIIYGFSTLNRYWTSIDFVDHSKLRDFMIGS